MTERNVLKLIVDFSIVIGLSLIGQYVLDVRAFFGASYLLPASLVRVLLTLVFWAAFLLLLKGVVGFHKLAHTGQRDVVVASLGMVVAITSLGQFAVKGLAFFQASYLPFAIVKSLLLIIFLLAVYFVYRAVRLYGEV